MANLDLDNAKLQRALWPPSSQESSRLRLEPLLTPELLVADRLFGIPLVSQIPDPVTGLHAAMTPAILQRHIDRALEIAESETGLTIMPTMIAESLPYDRNAFEALGYVRFSKRPIWGIETFSIKTADDVEIFQFPNAWLDTGSLYRGQINITPALLGNGAFSMSPVPASGAAAATFFTAFSSGFRFVPHYFYARLLCGFPDGLVPKLVNELIGAIAAMLVLSQLAATFIVNSESLGVDGLSQSRSGPGPQLWMARLKDLADDRKRITAKLRTVFALRFAFGVA